MTSLRLLVPLRREAGRLVALKEARPQHVYPTSLPSVAQALPFLFDFGLPSLGLTAAATSCHDDGRRKRQGLGGTRPRSRTGWL